MGKRGSGGDTSQANVTTTMTSIRMESGRVRMSDRVCVVRTVCRLSGLLLPKEWQAKHRDSGGGGGGEA